MIDPKNITNFNRTEAELQEFLLFCIVVAGKNSHQQAIKLEKFIEGIKCRGYSTPFGNLDSILLDSEIWQRLNEVKMGQYTRITKSFREVSRLRNLTTITVTELEKVKGIGAKTARFFVLHSRPNQNLAVLDTHILRWLREDLGHNAPKATPSLKRYLELEQVFLAEAAKRGMSPDALDLDIWKSRAQNLI